MLDQIFAIERFPDPCVTDNGPQFTSHEFSHFCEQRGIQHITTPPFHPASNDETERFVQTFKQAMRKNKKREKLEQLLRILLSSYHFSPTSFCSRRQITCRSFTRQTTENYAFIVVSWPKCFNCFKSCVRDWLIHIYFCCWFFSVCEKLYFRPEIDWRQNYS